MTKIPVAFSVTARMQPAVILYLNHASYIGGAEVALLDLLRYLDRNQYQPVVCAPQGELANALAEAQIPWQSIPMLDGLNRYTWPSLLAKLPGLVAKISKISPDLIHANTNFAAMYAGLLSRWLRIPTIGHIRDIESFGRMGRWCIRQNPKLIAISDAVADHLRQEQIPAQRIVRIFDGVDLRRYQPVQTPERQSARMIIGIVGQIGARKGHLYLLEAAQELMKTWPDAQYWIIGKEPAHSPEGYAARLHEYVREHHLESSVTFWGFRPDIPDLLAQLDILVVPSLQEPFGKIVIEGMAMAKPVVASAVGGIPEIVRDGQTGILIPPADSGAMYQALDTLLRNPGKRAKMGMAGRARVEQVFTLDQNARQTEQLYQQMLVER